jgi:hypothetical protein
MPKIDPNEDCPCGSGRVFKDCHGLKVRQFTTPPITEEVELKVISEPPSGTVSVFEHVGGDTILFRGAECSIAMVCGKCKSHLVVGVPRQNIQGIVLKCSKCGSYNRT